MYKVKQFHLKQNKVFHPSLHLLNHQYQTERDARSIYPGARLL